MLTPQGGCLSPVTRTSKVKIWVLDDDLERANTFRKLFGSYGHNITHFSTAQMLIRVLARLDREVEVLFLDHDLGAGDSTESPVTGSSASSGEVYCSSEPELVPKFGNKLENSGGAVARWLAEHPEVCSMFKHIVIHSSNPVGADYMCNLIPGSVKVLVFNVPKWCKENLF